MRDVTVAMEVVIISGGHGGIASLRASISYRQLVKSKCLMPRREPSIFFSFLMQVLDMPIYDNVDQSGD